MQLHHLDVLLALLSFYVGERIINLHYFCYKQLDICSTEIWVRNSKQVFEIDLYFGKLDEKSSKKYVEMATACDFKWLHHSFNQS